jgi:hypothetical protein
MDFHEIQVQCVCTHSKMTYFHTCNMIQVLLLLWYSYLIELSWNTLATWSQAFCAVFVRTFQHTYLYHRNSINVDARCCISNNLTSYQDRVKMPWNGLYLRYRPLIDRYLKICHVKMINDLIGTCIQETNANIFFCFFHFGLYRLLFMQSSIAQNSFRFSREVTTILFKR